MVVTKDFMVRVGMYLDMPSDPLLVGLCSPPSSEDKGEVVPATSHIGPIPHVLVAPEVMASMVSSAYWHICTSLVLKSDEFALLPRLD